MSWPTAPICCACWSLGIAVGALWLPVPSPATVALPLMLAAVCALAAAALRPLLLPLAAVAALTGLARGDMAAPDPVEKAQALASAGQTVLARGLVADDPRTAGGGLEFLLAPEAVTRIQPLPASLPRLGSFLVRSRLPAEIGQGDLLEVSGSLRLPADRPDFNRRAYLALHGSYLELVATNVHRVAAVGGPDAVPAGLRAAYRDAISTLLPPPHAAVLMGVVLGIRAGIPPELNQALIATGLVHLLVLSGLKVAVFARLAMVALRPMLGRLATGPVVGLIALYALAGGSTAAAVRAAAMGCLTLVALQLGRPTHVWTSLAVVAAAMLGWQPQLIWDVGFQLSFAGTAAIVLMTAPIEHRLRFLPRIIREPFAVTCAAQVGTLPLMAADFHLLSPVAPLANALVLPLLPLLVGGGLLMAPLAFIPDIGRPLALPLAGLLLYLEQVAALLARVPSAALPVARMPEGAGAAYYATLGSLLAALRTAGRRRQAALALALAAPLLIGGGELAGWAWQPPSASVLEIGEGQAVLLRGPGGYVLIDAGPDPTSALVITGPGLGHAGGLAGLSYAVDTVVVPQSALQGSAWRTAALRELAAGARLQAVWAGDALLLAGLRFQVLAPGGDGESQLAIRVAGPGASFCDLADSDPETLLSIAARLPGPCDYLLLPGGGRSGLPSELLAAARPRQLIASTASGRLARGLPAASVLRTDQEGTITVRL